MKVTEVKVVSAKDIATTEMVRTAIRFLRDAKQVGVDPDGDISRAGIWVSFARFALCGVNALHSDAQSPDVIETSIRTLSTVATLGQDAEIWAIGSARVRALFWLMFDEMIPPVIEKLETFLNRI